MSSVTFDGTEILNGTYIPRFVKHESAPDRLIASVSLARIDGEVLIGEWRGKKKILLQGTIVGSSQDDAESKIDAFKELFSRPQKNLDISWNGGTRRYVATCTKHDFDRDHFHTNAIPWTAEFTVFSGVGYNTSTTTPINASSISTDDAGTEDDFIYEGSFTIAGSKAAAPVVTMVFGTVDADMLGIEFINTDNNERIIVTCNADWSDATVIIDCANKQVKHNIVSGGTPLEAKFFGLFPTFKIGTNNFRIRTGGIVNQGSVDTAPAPDLVAFPATSVFYAQSFTVPYTDDTFGAFTLLLTKIGTPADTLYMNAKPDDGTGLPNYGATTLFDGIIDQSSVSTYPTYTYVTAFDTPATLNADTRYWLMVGVNAGDVSNQFRWSILNTYPRGAAAYSTDNGATWLHESQVAGFRVLFGGASRATDITLTVAYTKTYL